MYNDYIDVLINVEDVELTTSQSLSSLIEKSEIDFLSSHLEKAIQTFVNEKNHAY